MVAATCSSARGRSESNSTRPSLSTSRANTTATGSTIAHTQKTSAGSGALRTSASGPVDLEADAEPSADTCAAFRAMQDEATLLVTRPRLSSSTSLVGPGPRPIAYLAFVVLGCSAWIVMNVTYVELSALMLRLPESFSIFPCAIFALQSANVYPILLMLLDREHRVLKLNHAVWILLAIGFAVSVLLSIFWDSTAMVFGQTHSVAFLLLTHFGGLVSATSNVVLYPYVASFPPLYTSAYSTGGGLSGSLAALLGLVQKPYSSHVRFSVSTFYVVCAVVYFLSSMAFGLLEWHPLAKALRQPFGTDEPAVEDKCISPRPGSSYSRGSLRFPTTTPELHRTISHGDHIHTSKATATAAAAAPVPPVSISSSASILQLEMEPRDSVRKDHYRRRWHKMLRLFWKELVCFFALSSFAYAIIPSIMSFVYRRYAPGQDASMASKYQTYASIGALVLDPLARLVTSFYRVYCVYKSSAMLLVLGVMLLILSMMSDPLFSGTSCGYLFPLLSHVCFLTVFAYTQTMLFLQLKRETIDADDADLVQIAYQWSGLLTQIGALVGTMFIFPLTVCAPQLFQ